MRVINFDQTALYAFVNALCEWAFSGAVCLYIKILRFPVFLVALIPLIFFAIFTDIVFNVFRKA